MDSNLKTFYKDRRVLTVLIIAILLFLICGYRMFSRIITLEKKCK